MKKPLSTRGRKRRKRVKVVWKEARDQALPDDAELAPPVSVSTDTGEASRILWSCEFKSFMILLYRF